MYKALGVLAALIPVSAISVAAIFVTHQPPLVVTPPLIYNVVDYGAIGDGSATNAIINTTAFANAIAAASNQATPGVIYIPPSKGFVVTNGQLKINTPNVVIRGDASMGATPDWGVTSLIIGSGPGNTLEIDQGGCKVTGIVIKSLTPGQQTGSDASLLVKGNLVTISDVHINSPKVGIYLSLPPNGGGEFWLENILIDGSVGSAGIVANAGDSTVCIRHTIMFSNDPQPAYGIAVSSCGELIVDGGCDIINMGNCLGIVPGAGNVKGQHANAIFVSDSLFDGGNGQGAVYICPSTDAYVLTARFSNVWASTANNGGGTFPTNGFTFDGTQSKPPTTLRAIQDVCMTNCVGKGFVNHCGVYARGIQGLSIVNSTFGSCFNGIQIAPGCTSFLLQGNKCGDYVPPAIGSTSGGNSAYGILVEPNDQFIITGNMLYGNKIGGLMNMSPSLRQVVTQNLQ